MNKSDLIAYLARRYPQALATDAKLAVNTIRGAINRIAPLSLYIPASGSNLISLCVAF